MIQKRKIVMLGGIVEKPADQAEMLVQRGLAKYFETTLPKPLIVDPPVETAVAQSGERAAQPLGERRRKKF